MNRRLFVLSALALSGCATAVPVVRPAASGAGASGPATPGPPTSGSATSGLAELEPLYGADAGREAIVISVSSNGCTVKADFAFHVEQSGPTTTLAFGRKRIDTCKSFAMGRTDLRFTWAELGVAPRTPVVLLNPLAAWTGRGQLENRTRPAASP